MSETHCNECGQPWEDHEFAVPAPYCPIIVSGRSPTKGHEMSGIYDGPDGQKLHGDGKPVGSPYHHEMKISERAREAAVQLVKELLDKDTDEYAVCEAALQKFASEACKPLVEALEDVLKHRHEDKDGNHVMWVGETCFLICDNALKTHRLAHGEQTKQNQ